MHSNGDERDVKVPGVRVEKDQISEIYIEAQVL